MTGDVWSVRVQAVQNQRFLLVLDVARRLHKVLLGGDTMLATTHPEHERVSFERAVLPLRQSLFAAAVRLSRSRADADDLVQETVLRAWRFWARYQERETCRAWLHRILTNTFISRRRRVLRERDVLALAHAEAAEQARVTTTLAVHAEVDAAMPLRERLSEEVMSSIDALGAEQRAVVWLVDVQSRSYRQAADQLGWPIGTVMSRLHRARRVLRGRLSGLQGSASLASSKSGFDAEDARTDAVAAAA